MDVLQLQVLKTSFACVNAEGIFKYYLKGWFDFIFVFDIFCLVELKGYTIVQFHLSWLFPCLYDTSC